MAPLKTPWIVTGSIVALLIVALSGLFMLAESKDSTPALPLRGLLVSKNAAPVPAGDDRTIAHFATADDVSGRVLFDGYNRHLVLTFRRASGTAAAPSAVRSGDSFGVVGGTGYATSGYNSGPGSAKVAIDLRAAETWTDTAQGTFLTLETTRAGTTERMERVRVDDAGNFVVGSEVPREASNGFLYVPTTTGIPTGTPTEYPGRSPIVVNSADNKLYFYSGGAWRAASP
jgi:hypothetical protein